MGRTVSSMLTKRGVILMRKSRNRLETLAFLRFFPLFVIPLPLCQKMAIRRPVRYTAFTIVHRFSTMLIPATRQNDFLYSPMGLLIKKSKCFLKKIGVSAQSVLYSP